MNVVISSAPASEPITLTEAKAHLRVTDANDDTYITSLISAARNVAENETQRRFITQTWDGYLDSWPDCSEIYIPLAPLQSVTYLKYKNTAGVLTTLVANTDYVVDTASEPGRIALAPSVFAWPVLQLYSIQGVQLRFVCGYGAAANVPADIKQAILQILGHMYENRETVNIGNMVTEMPQTAQWLLHPYKFYNIV